MSNHLKRRQEEVKAEILIQLLGTGQVQVTGPLNKRELCKEMLRSAFQVIDAQESDSKIITPEGPQILAPGANVLKI